MNAFGVTDDLVEPDELAPSDAAIRDCEEAIEDAIVRIRDENWRGFRGAEYEEDYQQGRKDMARVVLVDLRGREHVTSEDFPETTT